ncbi:olfactory receptor 14A16-like [Apteryx mantelli]|uniref:Olfactory receptor 14A16-like n=1 Tax=Apteryx mantelli TaxID=2696672 RepID=A0ABM4G7D4_9AVES
MHYGAGGASYVHKHGQRSQHVGNYTPSPEAVAGRKGDLEGRPRHVFHQEEADTQTEEKSSDGGVEEPRESGQEERESGGREAPAKERESGGREAPAKERESGGREAPVILPVHHQELPLVYPWQDLARAEGGLGGRETDPDDCLPGAVLKKTLSEEDKTLLPWAPVEEGAVGGESQAVQRRRKGNGQSEWRDQSTTLKGERKARFPCATWSKCSSSFSEFLLLAFASTRELQLLHFSLFLGIYLAALLGNGLIITAVACDRHLHTPMYFFLLNLSVLDLGTISVIVPKSMANSLWNTRAISYSGCAAQLFLFVFSVGAEYSLLTVMAYDRFVAICKPLHYGTLMGSRACVKMAAAAWGSGFLNALLHTANTFSIPLCQGNVVEQFFCEVSQILRLSCSDSYLSVVWAVVISICLGFGCFVFIVLSYVQIFTAVLRIPSEQGRHKAFSMCLPHLAVVSLFVSTVIFAALKPPSLSSPALDLVMAVLYSVVPPSLNPLIYSMRNKELKDALRKLVQ